MFGQLSERSKRKIAAMSADEREAYVAMAPKVLAGAGAFLYSGLAFIGLWVGIKHAPGAAAEGDFFPAASFMAWEILTVGAAKSCIHALQLDASEFNSQTRKLSRPFDWTGTIADIGSRPAPPHP